MNGNHVEPDWRPLSPADTITLGTGGATIGWGVPPNLVYLEGPLGVDRDGPTPEEVAQGWVFGLIPTTWPDSQPQWLANDWGVIPYAIGAPPGSTMRFPIWYRWTRGSQQTATAPSANIPPPDATPILSSSDPTWGEVIPEGFGTRQVDAAPIWVGPVRRVAEHDFTGAVDFAVSFGRTARPEFHNVRLNKLFSNGKLIYDSNAGSPVTEEGVTVTFYPGMPDALPDPTIQAAEGAATPGFRRLFYAVIRNHPLFHSDTKLPSIRGELAELPDFQAPATTNMNQLSPPVGIEGEPVVADFDSGTFWAFSHTFGREHVLHEFDMLTNSEISRVTMDGSLLTSLNTDAAAEWNDMFADWWTLYDKYNGLIHFQHGFAESNGTRIGSVQLSSGKLVSSYGASTNNGTTDESNTGFSFYADFLRFRAFGTTIHGIAVGTIFHQAAVLTYRKQQGSASPGNDVKLSHAGQLKGGDTFTFGFDVAFDTDARPQGVCCYPVLDRPELISQFNVDTADFQNAAVLYGDGSALMEFEGSLSGEAPSDGGDASWQTNVPPRVLYDFPEDITSIFTEPQTGSILVTYGNGNVTIGMARLQPTWVGGAGGGCTLASVSMLWKVPVEVDGRLLGNLQRSMNMTAGTFAYADGGIVVRSLITGQEVYRHNPGIELPNDWVYDSVSQTIWGNSNDVDDTPVRLSLFSGTTATVPVTDFLSWCALRLGYEDADISHDVSISETVIGGNITEVTAARQAMITVAAMYSVVSVEIGGKIKFVRPSPGEAATLTAVFTKDDLAALAEGEYEARNDTTVAANDLAANVSVTCLDPANNYNPTTQTYKRVTFPFATSKSKASTDYAAPIVVTSEDSLNIAARLVLDGFAQGSVFNWRLPHRYLNVIPGDVIGFLADDNITVDELSQVREISYNGDYSMTVKGIRWALSDTLSLTVDSPAGRQAVTAALPSDSIAIALDIPLIDPTDETPGAALIYTGAGSQGQTWWKSAELHRSMDSTLADLYLATTALPWGTVSEALPATESALTTFATDTDTVLTISGRSLSANMFVSVSDEHFRAGYNAIVIGAPGRWEIVYFRDVEVVGATQFRLSNLLRGRRGTNVACDSHTGGEQAVLVTANGGRPAFRGDRLDFKFRGKQLSYYAVGENTRRSPVATTFSMQGASAQPWTVRRVRGKFASLVNAVGATSYDNECGQGSRHELISAFGIYNYSDDTGDLGPVPQTLNTDYSPQNLLDGSTSGAKEHSTTLADGQMAAEIQFDFHGSCFKQIIDEIIVGTFAGGCGGTWAVEATDDTTGSWTTLGTGLSLAGLSPTFSFTNTTGYWFYRLRQTAGTTTDSGSLTEVKFKCKAQIEDANDILITWLRRDRMSPAAVWVTDEQPMTETTEVYQVQIQPMQTIAAGSSFPKVLPLVNSTRVLYSAADQATDGFTPPVLTLGVRVAQLGQGVTGLDGDVSNRLGMQGLIHTVEVDS